MYEKIIMPVNSNNEIKMQDDGFYFADRTILASINLLHSKLEPEKLIRLNVIQTKDYKNEILEIAKKSFPYDRRFHLEPICNQDVANKELKKWVDEIDNALVCIYKDNPIGFLVLKETSEDTLFVHLAAVDEKYRLTGAAMSLYAYAMKYAKENGYKKLEGRISTQNTAIMNLYAYLGAVFIEPEDIFLKRGIV